MEEIYWNGAVCSKLTQLWERWTKKYATWESVNNKNGNNEAEIIKKNNGKI